VAAQRNERDDQDCEYPGMQNKRFIFATWDTKKPAPIFRDRFQFEQLDLSSELMDQMKRG
jgi:hypothetical protein